MKRTHIALLTLVAALAAAGSARAEPVFQINPAILQTVQTPQQSDHSADLPINPGGSSGSGESPKPISIKKTRNLPTPNTPGGGSSDGDLPLGGPTLVDGYRDYALVCEITESGALRFANRGGKTMPSGAKIKWKAGSQRGAFRLNIDLEPGASAAAPGMFDDDTVRSCWAAVI
jgi:hypothetical protein